MPQPPPAAQNDSGKADSGSGLAARRAALQILASALQHRRALDEALSGPGLADLDPRDRAFARALALTVLRRRGALDLILRSKLQRPPPDAVIELLRLGAAQLLYMDTPVHAAVSTSVDLAAERPATRPFRSLVNAVLRGLLREAPPPVPPQALAPDWLYARWRAAWGDADALAICELVASEPATDLTPRDADRPSALTGALAESLEAVVLPGGSLRTSRRGDVAGWPGYAEGDWWVQDASAAVPARLLGVRPGETALDLCAAPGGKTLQLAATGATVTALDRSAVRLGRVKENFERVGLQAEIVAAEAAEWPDTRQFDAVLLDAPCTATGTFRRHPDLLWASRPADVAKLAAAQAGLLLAAADRVRPGGRMVYCVCSLEREEGEAQIEAFLRTRSDFRLVPITPGEGGAPPASITAEGTLRILPHHIEGGADGFFAARLTRLPDPASKAKSSP